MIDPKIVRTMIIDGNHALHRVSHIENTRNLKTSAGVPIGGVYGLLGTMRSALRQYPGTSKVIITWDGGRSKRRETLHEGYKANRGPQKEDSKEKREERRAYTEFFQDQHEKVIKVLPFLGVRQCQIFGKEADDVIGILCHECEELKVIITEDRDLLQLVNDTTTMYRPIRDKWIHAENFRSETGMPTREMFILQKSLEGDTSDNIPGLKGVGKVTISRVLDYLLDLLTVDNGEIPQSYSVLLESLQIACGKMIGEDKRNRKAYTSIRDNPTHIRKNIELIDISREPFTDDEILQITDSLHPDNRLPFNQVAVLKMFGDMEFQSFMEYFSWWTDAFERLK